jgi:hypothetical protein
MRSCHTIFTDKFEKQRHKQGIDNFNGGLGENGIFGDIFWMQEILCEFAMESRRSAVREFVEKRRRGMVVIVFIS